jgi:hypothetical protein
MNASKKRKADTDDGEHTKRSKGLDGASQIQPGNSSGSKCTKGSRDIPASLKSGSSSKNIEESSNNPKHGQAKGKGKATNRKPVESIKDQARPDKPKHKIRKLVPPRPFPTVPNSVSATGPRSAHKEGKNYICLTRKTPLGAYLRRCKEVIMKDGYAVSRSSLFITNHI